MRSGVSGFWFASLAVGCGGSPAAGAEGFSAEPLQVLSSTMDQYQVAIRTSPAAPSRGPISVEYSIASAATGALVTGLRLQVVPWMPAMGHGTSTSPSVSEASPGTYLATNVDLYMPGQWVIRTTILPASIDQQSVDAGVGYDYVAPSLEIP